MELFKIFGTIGLNGVSQVQSDLRATTNQAENSSNKMGNAFKKLATIIGSVFAVHKIKEFGTQLVQTAGEVSAQNAQFEASFGDFADKATEMFNRVSEATGVFATRLQVTGTKGYSQLKGAGIEANEALKMTETFLNLASDASAYYDISLEDAEARIRSFLRGNVEAGDAIGLFTSESQRNAYAVEMYGEKWVKLTEAQKQTLMLKVTEDIYTQSGALGQAQREADGLANVTGNLKEVWRQFLAVVGKPVMEAVIPIMQKLTEKLKGMKTWVEDNEKAFTKIGDAISYVVDIVWKAVEGVISLISWFKEHETFTKILVGTILTLVTAFTAYNATIGVITKATKVWQIAQSLLNKELALNPIGLIVMAITALVALFIYAYKNSDTFRESMNKLFGVIKNSFLKILESLKPALEKIGIIFSKIGELLMTTLVPIFEAVISVMSKMYDICMPIFEAIWDTISWIVNAISILINGTLNQVINNIQTGINIIKQIFEVFSAFAQGDFEKAFSGIKNIVVMYFSAIRDNIKNKIDTIKNYFVSLWDNIKNIFGKIKSFFANIFSGLKIKLPHFKITGSANPAEWFKGKLPKIGVEWYAKGGVLTQPTIFGVNPQTGNAMVGGEAGKEAIAPIDTLKQYVAEAVSEANNNGNNAIMLERLVNLLGEYLPSIRDELSNGLQIDGKSLVKRTSDYIDTELGKKSASKLRYGV